MREEQYTKTVIIPDVEDFLKKYPRYSSFVNGEGRILFDEIMTVDVFIQAKVISDFGHPSVLGVAEICKQVAIENQFELDDFTKQFIGAAVCVLMEANDYQKTGNKKSVAHESFSKAEYYEYLIPCAACDRPKTVAELNRGDRICECGAIVRMFRVPR